MGTPSGRKKSGPRRGSGGKRQTLPLWRRGLGLTWDLWRCGWRLTWQLAPVLAVIFVALALFILNPTGLAMLAWSSVAGTFGSVVQVCVSVVLLSAAALLGWAFWPETQAQPKRRTSAATTRRARPRTDTENEEAAPAGGRRRRAAPQPATGEVVESDATPAPTAPPMVAAAVPDQSAAIASITQEKPQRTASRVRKGKARVPLGGKALAGQQAGD